MGLSSQILVSNMCNYSNYVLSGPVPIFCFHVFCQKRMDLPEHRVSHGILQCEAPTVISWFISPSNYV